MKRLIALSILTGLVTLSLTASAAPRKPRTEAQLAHQNDFEACVNQIARACDGTFSQVLTRVITSSPQTARAVSAAVGPVRGPLATDILDKQRLKAALYALGVKECGHFTSRTGISGVDIFRVGIDKSNVQQNAPARLVAFHSNTRRSSCTVSVLEVPSGITKMAIVGNRAFFTTGDKRVLFMNGNTAVRELLNTQGQPYSTIVDLATNPETGTVTLVRPGRQRDIELSSANLSQQRASQPFADLERSRVSLFNRNSWQLLLQ